MTRKNDVYATGGRPGKLIPAELKDGHYVKPVALLEIDQLYAGHREVWTASHGRATRYHVMVDHGRAACRASVDERNRTVIILNEDTLIPIGDVPGILACQRNGCAQLFQKFLK